MWKQKNNKCLLDPLIEISDDKQLPLAKQTNKNNRKSQPKNKQKKFNIAAF